MSGNIALQRIAHAFLSNVRTAPPLEHNSVVRKTILAICGIILSTIAMAQTTPYVQTNIISDMAGTASVTDPTLINPWGVSVGPAIWIDAAGSGLVKVDTATGAAVIPNVTIPASAGGSAQGSPSGTVFNSAATGFTLPDSSSALFLFGTLDGTIAGWDASSGTQAVTVVNNSSKNASYTDIALDTNSIGTFLLAADFSLGTVDVFNDSFAPAQLAGSFVDPNLPKGYSPFGIHSIGGNVYVTYAQVNPATGGQMADAGLGYVDEFDSNGNFIVEAITQNVLNAPWGMALAPAGFGSFGGDLLVGNFGDGVINAFNPTTFAWVGSLSTAAGTPIANPGLWEIFFGQGGTVGDPNTLYFAAGINGEKDGLFGSIGIAQPAGAGSFTLSSTATSLTVSAAQPGSINVSLAPLNGFSGVVTLSCTSTAVTCTFNSPTVSLSGTTATTVGISIAESAPVAPPVSSPGGYDRKVTHDAARLFHSRAGISLSLIGPIGLLTFAGLKRRSIIVRGSLFALLFMLALAGIAGCSSSMQSPASMASTTTPTTSNLTITATSGTITQSVIIAVTAQ